MCVCVCVCVCVGGCTVKTNIPSSVICDAVRVLDIF